MSQQCELLGLSRSSYYYEPATETAENLALMARITGRLESAGAKVSMDGKGRCLDNVFVERLWRTV